MPLSAVPVTERFPDYDKLDALNREAFPPAEYISIARQMELARRDGVDLWAFYDGETFVGFMLALASETTAYLFFLAIDEKCRSMGYGAAALQLFFSLYPNRVHAVDLEMQDDAADNAAQRRIRRAFYLRNGFRPTGHFFYYFGVPLEILCASGAFDLSAFQALVYGLGLPDMHPRFFTK